MSKRVVIEPHKGDKRYARRDAQGQFTDSQVNVGAVHWQRTGAANPKPWRQKDKATGATKRKVNAVALGGAHRLNKPCSFSQGRQLRMEVFSRPARRA